MTISELQAENEQLKAERDYCQRYYHDVVVEAKRLKAERDALAVQCESLLGDLVKVADAERERDEARAQAARLAEALQPFAAVQKAWMEEGRQSQIRMDWLTSVCEALASTDSLAWLNERKIAQLTELVEDMKHDRSIFEEHKWGWDAAMAYIEDTIAELRRKDD